MSEPGVFNVAIEAIIEKDGNILVTQRSHERGHKPGEWETLTGRVNQGETLEDAVHREVKEEVGLEVDVIKPFYTYQFFRGKEKIEHLGISFHCKYKSGEVTLDGNEQIDYKWVSPDEALKIIKQNSIQKAIRKFKEIQNCCS